MRVLVVEDEERLASTLQKGLKRHGFAVDVAHDGDTGLGKALANAYEVVVLDRNLPGMHGDDVCRELQGSDSASRVLMLTAAGELDDRVEGLELGADDYLTKPFEFAELVARIRALARRSSPATPPVLEHDDIALDPAKHDATRAGRDLELTQREFAVLEILLGADGRVVSSEELLERAWDEHVDPFSNVVRVIIARLRRKLGDPPVIETVVGSGYRL